MAGQDRAQDAATQAFHSWKDDHLQVVARIGPERIRTFRMLCRAVGDPERISLVSLVGGNEFNMRLMMEV